MFPGQCQEQSQCCTKNLYRVSWWTSAVRLRIIADELNYWIRIIIIMIMMITIQDQGDRNAMDYEWWWCSVMSAIRAAHQMSRTNPSRFSWISAEFRWASQLFDTLRFRVLFRVAVSCRVGGWEQRSMNFNKRNAVRWNLIGIYRWMLNALYYGS